MKSSSSTLTIFKVEFRTFEKRSIKFELSSSFELFNRVKLEFGSIWTLLDYTPNLELSKPVFIFLKI